MANPVKYTDLVEADALTKIASDARVAIEVLNGLIAKQKEAAVNNNKATAGGTKSEEDQIKVMQEKIKVIEKADEIHQEYLKTKIALKQAQKIEDDAIKASMPLYEKQLAQQQINKQLQKDRIALLKAAIVEMDKTVGTLQRLEAANTRLRIERKNLNTDTAEGKKRLAEINKELDKNNKYIKDNSDELKKQKLNVGNYKEGIKDALKETEFFNTGIGRLVTGLGDLKKKLDESAKESGKFSTSMKVGVAGGIGLAIVALKSLASVNASVAEGFEKISAQLVGFVTGGMAGAKAAGEFKEALFASYAILRELGIELQKVALDEGDFIDISNDATIGFKERNAALQESIRLSKERTRVSVEMAKAELDIINKQVASESIGLRKASPELLDKQAEAQKKLNEALDAQSDLLRENAQLERKLTEERTTAAIDLLLKSKQSANGRKMLLEQELADEKKQLERRRQAASELLEVNRETTEEELRIFKDGFKVKFNNTSLLNEQDAIALKQKIEAIQFLDENNKMVGLGVEAQKTLAEIVSKYQKDNIDYLNTKKKLQEEEIKRTQRIKEIEGEISVMHQVDDIKTLEDAYKVLDESVEKTYENMLDSPYSAKLDKKRKLQIDLLKQQSDDLYDTRVKLLLKQAEMEREAINNSIADEKIKAAEIKKINEQLQIDLANLAGEKMTEDEAMKKKELEQEKALNKKRLSMALDTASQITSGIAEGLQKRAEIQQAADQKDIDRHKRLIDIQAALAAAGADNVLAEELAASAKAEEKKLQDAKKAAKQQETIALIDTFTKTLQAGLNSGDPFIKAFGEALASEGLVSAAFSKLFAGFYEGTESVKSTDGFNIGTSKDSQVIRVHKGERILGVEDSADIPAGMTNKDVVAAAQMYMNPELKSTFFPVVNESALQQQNNYDTKIYELANEFRAMRKAFESKPVHQSNLGRLGEWTDSIRRENVNTIIHHKNNSKRPSLRLNG